MTIKKLTECKGGSRFGNCIECGECESDNHRLYRLHFNTVSICLCPDCFRKVKAYMNNVILDGYTGCKKDIAWYQRKKYSEEE